MHGLILLLQCLNALMEGTLFRFRVRVSSFGFHILHEWEDEFQECNLKQLCNPGEKYDLKKSNLTLDLFSLVKALNIALEHRVAILEGLELLLLRVEDLEH